MSTNSTIAIQNTDGTIISVYCHFDGYIDHNGEILFENYNDEDSVRSLINGGDMSVLKEDTESTFYYGRDRGEDDVQPECYDSLDDVTDAEEYFYLYVVNDGWYVNNGVGFERLSEMLKPS